MNGAVAIVSVGICCPLGLDAAQTAASLRARVSSRKTETAIMDRRFEPVVMAHLAHDHLPPLDPDLEQLRPGLRSIQRRMLRLATAPLQEVLAGLATRSPLPLFLAGPQPAAGQPEILTAAFLAQLAQQAQTQLDLRASRVFPSGHAGFFAAVADARDELLTGRAELVIVGGVDTYFDLMRLAMLDAVGRLRTQGPQDAFTPGEAAAFMLLASPASCSRLGLRPASWITAVGLGHEPGHRGSEAPYLGEGLAAAMAQVFEGLPASLEPVRLILSGFNGESFSAKESSVALMRNRSRLHEHVRTEHAAEYTGDAGAGLAPLMLAATAFDMRRGVEPGPALLWGASDQSQRGALLMHAAHQRNG